MARAAADGGRFGFDSAGPSGCERREHDFLEGGGVLWETDHPSLPSGGLAVCGDQPSRS